MENEPALVGMSLRHKANHIVDLALVPVGRGDRARNRREGGILFRQGQHDEIKPVHARDGKYGITFVPLMEKAPLSSLDIAG